MNETILIIDDNKNVLENTTEILTLANYNVITAENGIIGVELARKEKPALILCDITMPELDGYGVLQILESSDELFTVPFIFMTALSEKKDFRRAMDLGADDYLTKPFDGDELLRIVSARLKKSKQLISLIGNNTKMVDDFFSEVKSINEISQLSEQRTTKKFKLKETLFREGDAASYIYFVESGKIKTFKTNEDGKDMITEIYKAGDFFGYIDLLDDSNHKESASAIEESAIRLIPKGDFFKLLYSNNEITLKFIKLLSNNIIDTEQKLLKIAYNSARKKVADALIYVYKKHDLSKLDSIFSVNRENLSSLAGISRENVSRNLADFKEEGLIEGENGNIRILNYKKLETLRC